MIEELWNAGHSVENFSINKYTLLAKHYHNYRILYLNDIIKLNRDDIPKYIISFVSTEGMVIMTANIIAGHCVSIVFRSVNRKAVIMAGAPKTYLYGIGQLSPSFKYGDPIILVEGEADRDTLALFYPNVLGVGMSSISTNQALLLSGLTDKIILALDNDASGIKGTRDSRYKLQKYKINVMELKHPQVKDAGTILDYKILGNPQWEELRDEYKCRIRGLVSCLKS